MEVSGMSGAEYHGLTENFHKDNKGCTDWAYDEVYSETFGKKADQEYREDVQRYGKTCGLCLYVDICFCTFGDFYPEKIAGRAVS